MCKLLMIDDNQMEHLILQKMLSHYNLFTGGGEHSEDGKVTLDFIKSNHSEAKKLPDIILLDLNMPKFSGWDFLRNFKHVYPTLKKKIDIFILSSSIDPADQKRSRDYPFVKGFFIKPLDKDALIDLYSTYKVKSVIN